MSSSTSASATPVQIPSLACLHMQFKLKDFDNDCEGKEERPVNVLTDWPCSCTHPSETSHVAQPLRSQVASA